MKIRQVQKHGNPRWRVNLNVAGRQQRFFFKSEEDAETFVAAKEKERARLGISWLELSGRERELLIRAMERAHVGGYTLAEAQDAFEAHRAGAGQDRVTVETAIADCLKSKEGQAMRGRSLAKFKRTLERLPDSIRVAPVGAITAAAVEKWLSGHGWAPATRKGARGDLLAFFNWCRRRGYAQANPVESVPVPLLEDKAPEILTVPQAKSVLDAARKSDPGMCGFFALALFCGIRPAELLRLSPDNVRLKDGLVEVPGPKAKSRQRRLVKLPANAAAWCRIGMEWPPKNWRKRFDAVRAVAGLLGSWGHDAARHSFASYHLAAYGSADKTAVEMGHGSTAMLFAQYRELVDPAAGKRFFAIRPK